MRKKCNGIRYTFSMNTEFLRKNTVLPFFLLYYAWQILIWLHGIDSGTKRYFRLAKITSSNGAPKSNTMRSSVTHQSPSVASLRGSFAVFSTEFSLLFCFAFRLLTHVMHNYLTWLQRSSLARAPFVVYTWVDLKPLIEGGNLQVQ